MKKTQIFLFVWIVSIIVQTPFLIAATLSNHREVIQTYSLSKIQGNRIPIYIYSDFGGGQVGDGVISDWQTADELASQAWHSVGYPELFINDTATALSPEHASIALGRKFPYRQVNDSNEEKKVREIEIKKIVVHVVDPGVENESEKIDHHPRSIALRKDGILFLGPDNGTLSCVCPEGSLAGIWKINTEVLSEISEIDLSSGGTFHGRDVFTELAVRIASGNVSLQECSIPYESLKLSKRFSDLETEKASETFRSEIINFESIKTDRCIKEWPRAKNWKEKFLGAFYLQVIQSPLASCETIRPKIFWIKTQDSENLIAIANQLTGNVYIGPNNGWGSSFVLGYPEDKVFLRQVSREVLKKLENGEFEVDEVYHQILASSEFQDRVFSIPLGYDEQVFYDKEGKAKVLSGYIWIDAYGNIKTTIRSDILFGLWDKNKPLSIEINGVQCKSIWADSFVNVSENQVFCYAGSSAASGYNPKRSIRYIEVSANGRFGKFGKDFFSHEACFPQTSQSITIWLP